MLAYGLALLTQQARTQVVHRQAIMVVNTTIQRPTYVQLVKLKALLPLYSQAEAVSPAPHTTVQLRRGMMSRARVHPAWQRMQPSHIGTAQTALRAQPQTQINHSGTAVRARLVRAERLGTAHVVQKFARQVQQTTAMMYV